MTILAQDTFAGRTNSGTWNTASDGRTWAQLDGVGLILSVGSGEGKGHAGNHDTQMLLGSGTATDQEGLVRLALGQSGDSIGLLLRCDATGANYYFSEIGNFGNDITIYKVVGGAKTNLNVFAAGITISNGSFYWMRFQVIGTTLKTKIWADGSSEPASWAGSVTDSSMASGQYGIYLNSFGSIDAQFDSYQANDTSTISTSSANMTDIQTVIDGFSLTELTSFTESYTVIDSFNVAGLVNRGDTLTVNDAYAILLRLSETDIQTVIDSASAGTPPPVQPSHAFITLQAPRGTITLIAPRGNVTLEGV